MVLAHVDSDWRNHAACKGNQNTLDLMFKHQCTHKCTSTNGKKCEDDPSVAESRLICDSCPVMDRCRWWATITNQSDGMAGALTYAQRLVIRKRIRKDPIGNALLEGRIDLSVND